MGSSLPISLGADDVNVGDAHTAIGSILMVVVEVGGPGEYWLQWVKTLVKILEVLFRISTRRVGGDMIN